MEFINQGLAKVITIRPLGLFSNSNTNTPNLIIRLYVICPEKEKIMPILFQSPMEPILLCEPTLPNRYREFFHASAMFA